MILYLGNKLTKHGVNPTSVETLGERLKEFTEVLQYSDKKNPLLRMLDMWFQIWRWRKQVKMVLIDTYSTNAFHYAWTSAAFAYALNLPYVLILRGGNLEQRFAANEKRAKQLLGRAEWVVSPSGYLDKVAMKYTQINLKLIPNFIDISRYPFLKRSSVSSPRLLWVRAFDKIYQPQLAVEVLAALKAKGLKATLTFVGPDKDGSMGLTQDLAKELGVMDAIKFTGRLPKKDWIELSQEHDIFLNTTSIDNTPVSVMEAMALGMPIVTTKVGGIPYLFENNVEGIMVASPTVNNFCEAIFSLIDHPKEMERFSQAARQKAMSWDWETVKKSWKSLIALLPAK